MFKTVNFKDAPVVKITPKQQTPFKAHEAFWPIHNYPITVEYLDREIGAFIRGDKVLFRLVYDPDS